MREGHASSIAVEWKKDMMQPRGGGRMEEKAQPFMKDMHRGCASSTAIKKALP